MSTPPVALIVILLTFSFIGPTFAEEEKPLPPKVEKALKKEAEEKKEDVRDFLVQPKYKVLLKANSVELAPFVGPLFGDALSTTLMYGVRAQYHFNERVAVGADGGWSGTSAAPEGGDSYFGDASIAYHFHTVILPVNRKMIQSDLFLITGGGVFNTYGKIEPTGFIGGGTKIYFHKYAVLRVDVRDYIFQARYAPSYERKLTANTMIMIGLSFFLPTRVSEFHVETK